MTIPTRARETEHETLEKEASHVLEETRMVIPGLQALFGFQLIAVYNQPFWELLSVQEQRFHFGGVVLTAAAIALLMTPAAYHRQAEPHEVSRFFLKLSGVLLTLGMFMLMLSLEVDCYLIGRAVLKDPQLSAGITGGLGIIYLGFWFVLPRIARRHARTTMARRLRA